MVAPFGLSGLYPGEKEEYTRNLELLITSEALQGKIREMDAFFQAAFQANSRVWFKKVKKLEYVSPLKETEHGLAVTVKVYITGHKDPTKVKLFDSDLDPSEWEDGSEEDLNPGSDSLVMIKPDNLWFNENKYGVVLKAKMIVVKRGIGRRSYGLEDMIL